MLIAAEKGLFLARAANGGVTLEPVGKADTDQVWNMRELPGAGMLILVSGKGLFLARAANGGVTLEPVGKADTDRVWNMLELPGAGMLIVAQNGLFLARAANGGVTLERVPKGDASMGSNMLEFPGSGMLIAADKEWFLARAANGGVTLEPAGRADTGPVFIANELLGAEMLFAAEKGLFLVSRTPLSNANVNLPAWPLNRSQPRPDADLYFVFSITDHPCASAADNLDLRVKVIPPEGKPILEPTLPSISLDRGAAKVGFPLRINREGEWSFQLLSTFGGTERPVGELQHIAFASEDWRAWLEQWGWWLGGGLAIMLALANAAMFLFARHSVWAWRVATDDRLGTGVLRVATLALSHFPKAQVWILDLYFHRRRAKAPAAAPFLPLPLTSRDRELEPSDKALAPPWSGKRFWIQGSSGMGKTALFRHVTDAHFRDHDTAFAAFAKWGCIVAAFAARDFAGDGEDKDDPAWVVDAVRATLSGQGITFAG
jgi:hypothetical protein